MFTAIAPYYNELMGGVDYEMWADYLLLLLTMREKYPQTVLDVCCGTGAVSELLAQMHYKVFGVDISAPMIEEAQKRVAEYPEHLEFLASDAATFDLGRKFDAAFSFFDSFNYITDLGHLQRVFHNVAKHLEPGAPLIFDLNTAYAFEAKMFDQEDTRKKAKVQYKWVGNYDAASRIIRVNMQFWVEGQEFTEVHIQRAHTEDEIVDMLDNAGFEDIAIFDSYTLERPRKRSDRVHFVAIRS